MRNPSKRSRLYRPGSRCHGSGGVCSDGSERRQTRVRRSSQLSEISEPMLTGRRGTYVQTGFGSPDITVPMFRITTEEITIKGGWRYGSGD